MRLEGALSATAQAELQYRIEEEYLLVNRESRNLVDEPPPALVEAFETHLKGHFSTEMLRTQVEVGTSICQTIPEVREEVTRLRRTVADLSAQHGLAPIAASTHRSRAGRTRSARTRSATTCCNRTCSWSQTGC